MRIVYLEDGNFCADNRLEKFSLGSFEINIISYVIYCQKVSYFNIKAFDVNHLSILYVIFSNVVILIIGNTNMKLYSIVELCRFFVQI